MKNINYCYKGYIDEFLDLSKEEWLNVMKINYKQLYNQKPGGPQINAWKDCYEKLSPQLGKYRDKKYYLIFEYELPYEGGRRADLIILMNNNVLVVEFKQNE